MTRNVGNVDRAARAGTALAVAVAASMLGLGTAAGLSLLVLAAVLLATAAAGFCPLYSLFGISTADASKSSARAIGG